MVRKKVIYLVISPEKDILGCFGSNQKAEKFKDSWHSANFLRPKVVKMEIE